MIIRKKTGIQKPSLPWTLISGHPINKGLTGRWPLGEVAGTGSPVDISYFKNDIILTGSPTLGPGHHGGQSLTTVSASSQYGDTQSNFSNLVCNYSTLTLCVWAKLTTVGSFNAIAGLRQNNNGTFYILVLGNGSVECRISTSGGATLITSGTGLVTANTWFFGTVVYDGVNISYYHNGQFNNSSAAAWGNYDTTGLPFNIGHTSFGIMSDGMFDGVGIWTRAFSPTEIALLYNEPYAGIYNQNSYARLGSAATVLPPSARRSTYLNQAVPRASNW